MHDLWPTLLQQHPLQSPASFTARTCGRRNYNEREGWVEQERCASHLPSVGQGIFRMQHRSRRLRLYAAQWQRQVRNTTSKERIGRISCGGRQAWWHTPRNTALLATAKHEDLYILNRWFFMMHRVHFVSWVFSTFCIECLLAEISIVKFSAVSKLRLWWHFYQHKNVTLNVVAPVFSVRAS